MKSVRAAAIVILVGIGVALMGVPADAQQSTAASTPAPRNPNWCPDVPTSPPPGLTAEIWANERQTCMNLPGVAEDHTCGNYCKGAREMWVRASDASVPEKPSQRWTAEGKTQGQWTALREHCVALFSEVFQGGYSDKLLPRFSTSDWKNCYEITVPPTAAPTWPAPTDKQQGPFRLKNGAWMFIAPRLPAPKTPAPESTQSEK